MKLCFLSILYCLTALPVHAGKSTTNNDLVISDFKQIQIEQGKSKVYPLFTIKNIGSKIYKDIKLIYYSPKGLSSSGKNVSLNRSDNSWATVTLKPGQEVTFNPSYKHYTYLSASTDQALTTYSTDYYFSFKDQAGHEYSTHKFTINEFAQVVPIGGEGSIKEYQQKPKRKPIAHHSQSFKSEENGLKGKIQHALNAEILKLENIVHPKHLEGLKNILKQLESDNTSPTSHSPRKTSSNGSSDAQQKFQKDAIQYGLDMMNPLKSSQDVQDSFEQFKKSTEKTLGN